MAFEARKLAPNDGLVRTLTHWAMQSIIPEWHFPMMNDRKRARYFRKVCDRAIRPDMTVLEVGAGAGLLSMIAARAGAKHVFACEQNAKLANLAKDIIAKNDLADKITVIGKGVKDIAANEHFQCPVDMVIFDHIDSNILGYDIVQLFAELQHLIGPETIFVPMSAHYRCVLVASRQMLGRIRADSIEGFDFSPLDDYSGNLEYMHGRPRDLSYLSKPFDSFGFDFPMTVSGQATDAVVDIACTKPGRADGLLCWLEIAFSSDLRYQTFNDGQRDFRNPIFYPLQTPLQLQAGQTVRMQLAHDRENFYVRSARVI